MKAFRTFLLATSVAMALPAAAQADSVVRAVLGNDLQSLDPIFSTSYASRTLGYLAYDTLIARNSEGGFQPQMLEKWTVSDDGMTYTFTLRDGLKWHDGSAVTAADCVASLTRWGKKDGLGGRMFAATESLTATDDKTFVLKLAKPFGLVVDALAKESSPVPFMMPERLAKTDVATALTEVDGSGPFTFKADAFVPGSIAVFEKNDAYVPRGDPADRLAGGKVVKVDRVELKAINDAQTQVAALAAGEVDFLQYVPYDLLPVLTSDAAVTVADPGAAGTNIGMIRVNHLQPPFDKPEVRLAFQMAVDRAEVLTALGGTPEFLHPECLSYFGCNGPYAATEGGADLLTYDLDKVKAAVAASGYKGEKIVLMVVNDGQEALAGPVVEAQLKRAGFNVEVQLMDIDTLFERRTSKEPVDKGGWSAFLTYLSEVDVGSPATNSYVTSNYCNPNYPGWTCDEKINTLLGEFLTDDSYTKRKEIANAINVRAHETVPAVLWGQFTTPLAYRNDLTDVIVQVPTPVFWSMEKK